MPINTELVPDVNISTKKDLKYKLIPGVNYELDQELKIEHQYVRVGSVDQEINIEKEIIIDFQKSAIDSENSALIYAEINEHKSRLAKLELVRETAKDASVKLKKMLNLKTYLLKIIL